MKPRYIYKDTPIYEQSEIELKINQLIELTEQKKRERQEINQQINNLKNQIKYWSEIRETNETKLNL